MTSLLYAAEPRGTRAVATAAARRPRVIVPHPCGPFAALDGIGGGSIKPGEERLCDTAHGH